MIVARHRRYDRRLEVDAGGTAGFRQRGGGKEYVG
jgi:hypothetical protein